VILTVTLNAALDITYQVDTHQPGHTHRVRTVHTRPGGKGVNVADVLTQLGEPVHATGLAGPDVDLPDFVPITEPTRRTTTILTPDGTATLFNEPGPHVTAGEWATFLDHYDSLAPHAHVVVLSGSLPPGIPTDAYTQLINRTTTPVILDTDGDPLRHGLTAQPALIKPNQHELQRLLGRTPRLPHDCHELGVPVAATLGPAGAVLSTPDGCWTARPPRPVTGNPTGAGDAFTAALARGLTDRKPWPDILTDAVALSAAAVAAPHAGAYNPTLYRELTRLVDVKEG
jgi:tagatose 6-phosphate kinase